jgi:hypothetical protein
MRRFGRLVAHVAEHLIPEPHRGNVDTVYACRLTSAAAELQRCDFGAGVKAATA